MRGIKNPVIDRWAAVRKGPLYCAPACGFNCTWADFQYATKKAAALCKKLGPGWEPRVWENGGWHYSAGKGACEVHASYSDSKRNFHGYNVYFNSATQVLGKHATDPRKAVKEMLKSAHAIIQRMSLDVSEIEW